MEQIQLKPCPFCGGGAIFEEYAYNTDGRIICVRCGATSSNEWCDSSGKDWKVKAAEKWNRRANNGSVN